MKNRRTPDFQKTKSVDFVNKTGKVMVHVTDGPSWNSHHTSAADHEFTFGSAIEFAKKIQNVLWWSDAQ